MKLHLVYAIPQIGRKNLIQKIIRKIKLILSEHFYSTFLFGKRRYEISDFKDWPVQSPFENTKNIYLALNNICPTYLYHLTEKSKINFERDDIFLGHPYFPITDIHKGVTEIVLNAKKRPKITSIITPLHCNLTINTSHINLDFLNHVDKLVPNCDILFGIMGEYWWDQWKNSKFAHWQTKMVRLDMAVNINNYPKVKNTFNLKGKRKFLFIGRNDPMKGSEFLSELALALPQFEFGWIGSGAEINGVKRISSFVQLTPDFMKIIASEYDFFISPSLADPNPTTILESMAWGFPILSTLESGYYESDVITNIFSNDLEKSKVVLEKYQFLDEKELMSISKNARNYVNLNHSWDKFTQTISSSILKKYNEK
jgi:glycosyltransferase involved in cell wall biosynthesis